jgi:hypothetical protein
MGASAGFLRQLTENEPQSLPQLPVLSETGIFSCRKLYCNSDCREASIIETALRL